jgi:hypothetical protein
MQPQTLNAWLGYVTPGTLKFALVFSLGVLLASSDRSRTFAQIIMIGSIMLAVGLVMR